MFLSRTSENPRDLIKVTFSEDFIRAKIANCQNQKVKQTTLSEIFEKMGLSEIAQKWGESLNFGDENKFRKLIGKGIDIYTHTEGDFYNSRKTISSFKCDIRIIISEDQESSEKIHFNEKIIEILDSTYLRPYLCDKSESCFYSTRKFTDYQKHLSTCSEKTKMVYQEVEYGNPKNTEQELRDLGIIKNTFKIPYCTWDIETLSNTTHNFHGNKTKVVGVSELASIGYYFSSSEKGVFVRQNDSAEAATKLVSLFLRKMEQIQQKIYESVDPEIIEFYGKITEDLKQPDLSVVEKSKLYQYKNFLRKSWQLILVGYNSSAFDLPCILSEILETTDPESVKCIKNGQKFFSLEIGNLQFRDALNYWGGGSLSSFAASFSVPEPKGIFPYERYTKISQMFAEKTFPSISDFKSTLGKPVDKTRFLSEFHEVAEKIGSKVWDFFGIEQCENAQLIELLTVSPCTYYQVKTNFDEKISSGSYTSFVDQLVAYNLSDCEILFLALKNYNAAMHACFGVNIFMSLSLPGLSESIMWSLFDGSFGKIYSLGPKFGFLNKQIRDSLLGGPCLVFHRHSVIQPENSPEIYDQSVYFTPSGERNRKIVSFDFNGNKVFS